MPTLVWNKIENGFYPKDGEPVWISTDDFPTACIAMYSE